MNTVIKNAGADYSAGTYYYSKLLKVALCKKNTNNGIGLNIAQLYLMTGAAKVLSNVDLSGNTIDIVFLGCPIEPNESLYDIVDSVNKIRIQIIPEGTTTLAVYYYTDSIAKKITLTTTEPTLFSLGITKISINTTNWNVTANAAVYTRFDTPSITVANTTSTIIPDESGIVIQEDSSRNTGARFRHLTISIDGKDVSNTQVIEGKGVYDWVIGKFFETEVPIIPGVVGDSTKRPLYMAISTSNDL